MRRRSWMLLFPSDPWKSLHLMKVKLRQVVRQQDGMTLIEVLAAILITSIILGSAITLLFTIQSTATVSTKQERQQSSVRWTTKQLQNELTRATSAVFVRPEEARFLFGNKMKALIFDQTYHTWKWYDYTVTPADTVEQIKQAMSDTSISLASSPDKYKFTYELSNSLTAPPAWVILQSATDPADPNNRILVRTTVSDILTVLTSNSLIEVTLQFSGVRTDRFGRPITVEGDAATEVQVTIKPLTIQ